nr:LOW QUALITY PROTEIN: uncharacterized protein LOC121128992 [Lepeophtheirus salmonis]
MSEIKLLGREDVSKLFKDESLLALLQENAKDSSNHNCESKQIEDWLNWCRDQKRLLKVIERPVPPGILPSNCNGDVIDVRVGGGGPDDTIFKKYPLIQQRVARGNSVLRLKDPEGQITYQPLIFALKKFTGESSIDEDDVQEDQEEGGKDSNVDLYFLKPISQFKEIVATAKANGEAAHFSAHFFKEVGFVLCIGSKNVHLLARSKDDLNKYTESRYSVAKVVAEAVFSTFQDLNEETLERIYNFSHYTKLTWTFELLNPGTQHVVNLSHLKSPQLNFIAWTLPYFDGRSSSLCAIRPDIAYATIEEHFGLKSVSFDVVKDRNRQSELVKMGYGYEGDVFYFIDEYDNVIGLMKIKTVWYIMIRAIREKAKRYKGSEFSNLVTRRFKSIQQWLNLTDAVVQNWTELALNYGKWMDSHSFNRDFSTEFPISWKSFLLETKSSDDIKPIFISN